jgi:hypothetical protein
METSGDLGSDGMRPTVEFVEDLVVDHDKLQELIGRRLEELEADELLEVAVNTSDKTLLLDVIVIAGARLAAVSKRGDIDTTEQWQRVGMAIEAIWQGGNQPEEDTSRPVIWAIVSARTESGELVL